jgi:hypothetical protein
VASVKALSAAAYWKEWSCAIPFKSDGWAAGEQEFGKITFPSPAGGTKLAGSCRAWQGENGAKTIKINKNLTGNIGNTTRSVQRTNSNH